MGFENLIEILLRMLLSSRAANSGRFHNFLYKFCSGNGTPVAATPKWEFAKSIQAKYAHFDKSDMSAIARFATNEERNWQLVRPCRVHLNTLDAHGRLCEKWMTPQHTPGRPAIITDRWVRWTPGTIISQTQTRDSSSIASRRYIYSAIESTELRAAVRPAAHINNACRSALCLQTCNKLQSQVFESHKFWSLIEMLLTTFILQLYTQNTECIHSFFYLLSLPTNARALHACKQNVFLWFPSKGEKNMPERK